MSWHDHTKVKEDKADHQHALLEAAGPGGSLDLRPSQTTVPGSRCCGDVYITDRTAVCPEGRLPHVSSRDTGMTPLNLQYTWTLGSAEGSQLLGEDPTARWRADRNPAQCILTEGKLTRIHTPLGKSGLKKDGVQNPPN